MGAMALEQHYQLLWKNAAESFEQNQIQIDENLLNKQNDLRRGMTLLIRPNQAVIRCISLFLSDLANAEPNQYFYNSTEFHITLLSLFTATENYQPYYDKQSSYLRAVDKVLSQTRSFKISFRGITASPDAVMIQGFPANDALNHLRDRLRLQLTDEGLSDGLDRRYKIKTAHTTVFRFQSPPTDIKRFLQRLHNYRSYDFGEMIVNSVQMVENDWYMSHNEVNVIKEWKFV